MNYQAHYDRLIDRARERVLDGYSERHHVRPVCLGGSNDRDNLVDLTPEEHYVAHQLLVKIHPRNGRLVHAAVLMSTRCSGNKAYGWLKRRHIASLAISMRGNTHTVGYTHTPEARALISAAHKGRKHSAEHRAKRSEAMRGNTNGLGKKLAAFSDEHRAKLSAAHMGKKHSPEHCAKIAASNTGKTHPGRKLSQQEKDRISALHLGRKRSPETCARITAGKIAAWARKRSQWTPE